jgi:signal transduction histidine kinase
MFAHGTGPGPHAVDGHGSPPLRGFGELLAGLKDAAIVANGADEPLSRVVLRDVAELRRLEALRAEWLALFSHDVRTPLAALLARAEMLERALSRAGNCEIEAKHARHVVDAARRLDVMLEELLVSASLETDGLDVQLEVVELQGFIEKICEEVAAPAEQARLQVEVEAPLRPVALDVKRMQRAFLNLLSNAFKYSPATEPVRVRLENSDANMVLLSVHDRGRGIPPDEVERVFHKFYRLAGTSFREGEGLGLYVVRQIAEAHGGRAWCESTPGEGSSFFIALPAFTPT